MVHCEHVAAKGASLQLPVRSLGDRLQLPGPVHLAGMGSGGKGLRSTTAAESFAQVGGDDVFLRSALSLQAGQHMHSGLRSKVDRLSYHAV